MAQRKAIAAAIAAAMVFSSASTALATCNSPIRVNNNSGYHIYPVKFYTQKKGDSKWRTVNSHPYGTAVTSPGNYSAGKQFLFRKPKAQIRWRVELRFFCGSPSYVGADAAIATQDVSGAFGRCNRQHTINVGPPSAGDGSTPIC